MQAGARDREGERENSKQAPCLAQSLMWSSICQPWDHGLTQIQESGAQPTL